MTRSLLRHDELIGIGSEVVLWEVLDPSSYSGHVKLIDRIRHCDEYKPLREIHEAIAKGELKIKRLSGRTVAISNKKDMHLDKDIEFAMQSLRLVIAARETFRESFAVAYDRVKKNHQSEVNDSAVFPSRATLYRYHKLNRDGLPVLQGNIKKGNRSSRYPKRVEDLICDLATALFLTQESRWTLNDLVQKINLTAREQGWIKPKASISKNFVGKTIRTQLSADPEIDRMDPKKVAAAKSIATTRIVVNRPFERIEQDAVHLPFVIQTPHGPVNNLYLIHAIDCATGMPIGWNLVVGNPSESDGLKCIQSMLFPKSESFKELGLEHYFDICGLPSLIIFDNGPETRGERMRKLQRFGIDTKHCKSRHPHEKPFIERLNKSLKIALQTLSGCTRANGEDGQRNPVELGDTLKTFEELKTWIVRWYFEEWAHTPLDRHLRNDLIEFEKLGNTPAARWVRMQELGYAILVPPSLADWRHALFEHETRTLSRKTGITCRGFNFRGKNLTALLKKYGEVQVDILVDPDDYRMIFVNEGDGLPLVQLVEEYVEETSPAHSFAEMQIAIKDDRSRFEEDPRKTKFRKDVYEDSINTPKAAPKKRVSKAERNRETEKSIAKDQAVIRAAANPIKQEGNVTENFDIQDAPFVFCNVPPLVVVSRIDGKERE